MSFSKLVPEIKDTKLNVLFMIDGEEYEIIPGKKGCSIKNNGHPVDHLIFLKCQLATLQVFCKFTHQQEYSEIKNASTPPDFRDRKVYQITIKESNFVIKEKKKRSLTLNEISITYIMLAEYLYNYDKLESSIQLEIDKQCSLANSDTFSEIFRNKKITVFVLDHETPASLIEMYKSLWATYIKNTGKVNKEQTLLAIKLTLISNTLLIKYHLEHKAGTALSEVKFVKEYMKQN